MVDLRRTTAAGSGREDGRMDTRYPDLDGKVAVVTGGSRGIGAETARALAHHGARVLVTGRDAAALDEMVAELRFDGAKAHGVVADGTDYAAVNAPARWPRRNWDRSTC